jgi:hypothetical protein
LLLLHHCEGRERGDWSDICELVQVFLVSRSKGNLEVAAAAFFEGGNAATDTASHRGVAPAEEEDGGEWGARLPKADPPTAEGMDNYNGNGTGVAPNPDSPPESAVDGLFAKAKQAPRRELDEQGAKKFTSFSGSGHSLTTDRTSRIGGDGGGGGGGRKQEAKTKVGAPHDVEIKITFHRNGFRLDDEDESWFAVSGCGQASPD